MRSVLLLGLSLVSSLALAQEPEGADAPTEAGAIPPSPEGPARPPEPPDANTNLSKLLSLEEQLQEAVASELIRSIWLNHQPLTGSNLVMKGDTWTRVN